MERYLDLTMLLNFLVDFLLLLGTNRLSGFPASPGRTGAAAALGAVYSGACLLPELAFLGGPLWRGVCLLLMSAVAFGWNRGALGRTGTFLLLSMALGGLALSLGRGDLPALVLAALGLWLLCRAAFPEGTGAGSYVPVSITHRGERVDLIALRDTGNTLRDPVTGEQVLVISSGAAGTLTGLTEQQLRSPLQTLTEHPAKGLRLIPYRSVGAAGLLLAMRFEDVRIGSRRQSALVAFAPEPIGRGNRYQALTGGAL